MSEKVNSAVMLNGDQVYLDELIRENARLTVMQEAFRVRIAELEQQIEDQAANIASLEVHSYARESADDLRHYRHYKRLLKKAVNDLHFFMAGGDPCKVCAKKCMMGEGNCQPVWTGEKEI